MKSDKKKDSVKKEEPSPSKASQEESPLKTDRSEEKKQTVEEKKDHHNVQAIAQTATFGDVFYTVYCDNQEFSQLEYGDALFAAIAGYIASLRRSKEQYPCYITDLDLSQLDLQGAQLQTVQFLQHKEKLEKAINQALKIP